MKPLKGDLSQEPGGQAMDGLSTGCSYCGAEPGEDCMADCSTLFRKPCRHCGKPDDQHAIDCIEFDPDAEDDQ